MIMFSSENKIFLCRAIIVSKTVILWCLHKYLVSLLCCGNWIFAVMVKFSRHASRAAYWVLEYRVLWTVSLTCYQMFSAIAYWRPTYFVYSAGDKILFHSTSDPRWICLGYNLWSCLFPEHRVQVILQNVQVKKLNYKIFISMRKKWSLWVSVWVWSVLLYKLKLLILYCV